MIHFYKAFILFFIAFAVPAQSQTLKVLKGKVVANSNDLEGIYIINTKSDFSTLTENGGYFSIPAKEGDTLMFSAVQFKGLKVVVKKTDFDATLFFVKMEIIMRQLDEVKINEYKNINAVSLGIISPYTKHYTPAERKLRTANGSGVNQFGTSTVVSFDAILNSFSGRTTMLKKEVLVERKEFLLKKINDLFEEKYFVETLKIPKEYVNGFQYYLVENSEFAAAINDKNKIKATFVMNKLAVDYLELFKEK